MQWPTISWASDQGADAWCSLNYLRHMRVAVMRVADQSHRIANDCDLALQDAGLAQVVALTSFIIGTDAGLWGQGRWYQSMVEATDNYIKLATPESCALFCDLIPQIAADLGDTDQLGNAEWEKCVFEDLKAVYARKESRVPGTRWFAFVDCATEFLPKWHTKLLLVLYHLLQCGHFDQADRLALLKGHGRQQASLAPTAMKAGAPEELVTTSRDKPDERDLRRRCANQLQLQAVVLSDGDLHSTVKACTIALAEARKFHGQQNKQNRSCDSVRSFYVNQACGGGVLHLKATAATLRDMGDIESLGMRVPGMSFPPGEPPSANQPSAWLAKEDDLARKFASLVTSLLGRRLTTLAWSERQLPGKLAGLLSEEGRAETIHWLKKADLAWTTAQKQTGTYWKRVFERSAWNQLVVQKDRLGMVHCSDVGLGLRALELSQTGDRPADSFAKSSSFRRLDLPMACIGA